MFKHGRFFARAAGVVLAASILLSLSACLLPTTATSSSTAYQNDLYMVDSANGKIYTYDPSTHTASSTSLASTKQNASGTISFHNGIGYVGVAPLSGGNPGVYWFDPSAASPSFTELSSTSGAIKAEYFAFASATTAYVSVVGTYDSTGAADTGGIYTFDPTQFPTAAISAPIAGINNYLQDIKAGADGRIYTSALLHQKVFIVDPSNNNAITFVPTNAPGPTGLCAGSYKGIAGMFVASTGNGAAGAIDFIPSSGTTASPVVAASAGIFPTRVIQLSNDNLVATGWDTSFASHTWLITLGSTVTVTELKDGAASFGGGDLAESNGLVYVPMSTTTDYVHYTNQLYIFDESGTEQSYSPVSVMTSADNFTNLAFFSD